jgi:hypothetical protein
MRLRAFLWSLSAVLLFPGCLAVDDGFYQGLEPGDSDVQLAEACGDESAVALADQTRDIHIDTTQAVNNLNSMCSSTPGNDLFIAFDVTEGEYWHFHLSTDNDFPSSAGLNPALYLLTEEPCDDRNCDYFSNRCAGTGDEHFAFVASTTGRYYLGIDDVNPGGGHYLLQALRPTCGNGTKEHGESCDDGSHCADGTTPCTTGDPSVCQDIGDGQCAPRSHDGCDRDCRQELPSSGGFEAESNDNLVEANVLRTDLPGQSTFIVNGAVGGPSDCYPDVFAVFLQQGQELRVTALESYTGGVEVPCTNLTSAPVSFLLTSNDPDDSEHRRVSTEIAGCPVLTSGAFDAGEYFITVDADAGLAEPAPYVLKFEVVGP